MATKNHGNGNVTKVLYIEHDDDNLYVLKTALSGSTISRFSRQMILSKAASWHWPSART